MHANAVARLAPRHVILLIAAGVALHGCGDQTPSTGQGEDPATDIRSGTDLPPRDLSDQDGTDEELGTDTTVEDADAVADAAVDPTDPVDVTDVLEATDVEVGADSDGGPVDPGVVDGGVVVPFVPRSVPQEDGVFPLGVQAGSMTSESVRLWTYAPGHDAVVLRVWRPIGEIGSVAMVVEDTFTPNDAGYLHVDVGPLAPGTWYSYGFYIDGDEGPTARSSLGRVRTAFGPSVLAPVTVGATSCTSQSRAPWEALSLLAESEIDLIIHTGDMSYNDDAEDLDEYRREWRDTLDDPGYRDLLPAAGMYGTWDDHEVDNDYDPTSIDADRLRDARDAYFESLPARRGPEGQLWTSYQWGDSVEFIIMDCRSERDPETIFGGTTYISEAQMDFVLDRLENSTAHFKVLLNSVPITNMGPVWDAAANDRWEGYPTQRDQLLDFIVDNEIPNVWFLSGDFHVGFISRIEPEGPRSLLREIAVGPGGNGPNPLGAGLALQPQFEYSSLEDEVATTITFDPVEDTVHVRFVNADGDVLFDASASDAEDGWE